MTEAEKIIEALKRLINEPGFVYSFSYMLLKTFTAISTDIWTREFTNRMTMNEMSLIIGLIVKNKIELSYIPTTDEFHKQIRQVTHFK